MSEADMIKEVRAKGPMLVDFNAGPTFQAYKSGVLSEEKPVSEIYSAVLTQINSDTESGTYCYEG